MELILLLFQAAYCIVGIAYFLTSIKKLKSS